ncbi:MAG: glutamyl-tRNA reductase [Lachnospiraceae bacterium]|nr:glutamyl-tRNA reductase [Lachnospiraceae bacterium]MDY5742460.1 glutamyl-tRNA reductase [Lachnospiraceae bacterium]
MKICMLGVDYRTVTMDARQPFYLTSHQAADFGRLCRELPTVTGCVILSTCNRTEIWLEIEKAPKQTAEDVLALLCRHKELPPRQLGELWQYREDREAIQHLMQVAAGLRSQVLGDDQILTQLKSALTLARHAHMVSVGLELLFRDAVHFGKKIKNSDQLPHRHSSMVSAGFEHLEAVGFTLRGRRVLVIGNGEMGYLASELALTAGAEVWVTVRQYRKGEVRLAKGVRVIEYENRYRQIPDCDLVVSATASPNLTIMADRLCELALPAEQIYLDLALPRDIDPEIDRLDGIQRFDLDDIGEGAESIRHSFAERLEEQVYAAATDFQTTYAANDLAPLILGLRDSFFRDVARRSGGQSVDLDDEQWQKVRQLMRQSIGKAMERLLFSLQKRYRQEDFETLLQTMQAIYSQDEEGKQ